MLTQVAAGDKEDVDRAVKAARAAFEKGSWAQRAPVERKKVLIRFAELIEKHSERAGAARDARHGQAHLATSPSIDIRPSAQTHPLMAEAHRQDL